MKYQTDTYSARVRNVDGNKLAVEINEQINLERLKTIYDGYVGPREVEIRFIDPRKFTKQQRYFFFALVNDINAYTGQPRDDLKEMFYFQYEQETGREISLRRTSTTSMTDARILIDIIIEFVFSFGIPMKKGFEVPEDNMNTFYYWCIKDRRCCVQSCGGHAQLDHFDDTVGMGRDRNKIDNTNNTFAALCNKHHREKHDIGLPAFKDKYHVWGIKLDANTVKEMHIGGFVYEVEGNESK